MNDLEKGRKLDKFIDDYFDARRSMISVES
jgi:hypothetical protein